MQITPVILSGGAGTRLWPLSRQNRPKQFLNLFGEKNMFQQTVNRVSADLFNPALIICNEEHRFLVAESLRELSISPQRIILEPEGRNTAPAITLAALLQHQKNENELILVLPSDHYIENLDHFLSAIEEASLLANAGKLVTFGITPDRIETGYGYIRKGQNVGAEKGPYDVAEFIEKPSYEKAGTLIEQGCLWNSGMLLFSVDIFLQELEKFHPDILENCRSANIEATFDLNFMRVGKKAFSACESISIDYAVMEQTERAAVVELSTGWSDLGSFTSLDEIRKTSATQNTIHGDVVSVECENTFIMSDARLVAGVGLKDMLVVVTHDAVLVCPKDRAQDIGSIVKKLENENRVEATDHPLVQRFWGHYQVLEKGNGFLVKKIVVSPKAKLSLQRHQHRAEHWIVVQGQALVSRADETYELHENESTYIPQQTVHRLENKTDSPLHLIEIQTGDNISEEDIERISDIYSRETTT